LKVSRQLHSHEQPTHEEGYNDAQEAEKQEKKSVQLGQPRTVGFLHDNVTETSHSEEEARGESFHDVLAVHSVRHEGHGTGVSLIISGGPDTWRFNDDVIDDTTGDEKVGEENQREHEHGGGSFNPCWFFQL